MKTYFLLAILAVILLGCEESIHITTPTILTQNTEFSVSEESKISVEEYAEIDGDQVKADYYEWFIENSEGNIVKNDFKDSSAIYWTPENAGYFVVKVKIGYNSNKSITAVKEVNVYENVKSIQDKLAGHWKGTGARYSDKKEWGVDLYIDSTGHYYGTADYYSFDPYCEKGVFNTARTNFSDDDLLSDSCGIPEEVSCQKIEIIDVNKNKGIGVAWIGWTYYNNGNFVSQHCTDIYDVEEINISDDGNTLYLEFDYRSSEDGVDWEKKFELTRQ